MRYKNHTTGLVTDQPPPEMYVGVTILQQIRAADRWALPAWGARDFVTFSDGFEVTGGDENGKPLKIGERGGGVMFRVRGTRQGYGRSAKILVGLAWDDTYTVVGGRVHQGKWKTLDVETGVYFDQLVPVISQIVR